MYAATQSRRNIKSAAHAAASAVYHGFVFAVLTLVAATVAQMVAREDWLLLLLTLVSTTVALVAVGRPPRS